MATFLDVSRSLSKRRSRVLFRLWTNGQAASTKLSLTGHRARPRGPSAPGVDDQWWTVPTDRELGASLSRLHSTTQEVRNHHCGHGCDVRLETIANPQVMLMHLLASPREPGRKTPGLDGA